MLSVFLCGIATVSMLGNPVVTVEPVATPQSAIEATISTDFSSTQSKSFSTIKGYGPTTTKSYCTVKGYGHGNRKN